MQNSPVLTTSPVRLQKSSKMSVSTKSRVPPSSAARRPDNLLENNSGLRRTPLAQAPPPPNRMQGSSPQLRSPTSSSQQRPTLRQQKLSSSPLPSSIPQFSPAFAVRSGRPAAQSVARPPLTFADDDPVEDSQSSIEQQPEPDPALRDEGPLCLSTRIEYSSLPRGQTQNIFGLVSVKANADVSETKRQPTDIICVLDVSGSMSCNGKIDHVKSAVEFIIANSDPRDRLSIVTFNSSASRVLPLRRMTNEGKDEANMSRTRLYASGGTSIASGLDMALQVLEQRRQRNKVSAILLLTDGQDGSTRPQLPALLARAREESCAVYAFGFGSDHDAVLMAEVSEQAKTPFTYVEDTENLQDIFAGAVGGLTSVVAQDVELTLTCQVPLKQLHTPFPVQRDADGQRATVRIPDIFAGETRDVLVELEVPAGGNAGPDTLFDSRLQYRDLHRGCVLQTPLVSMQATRVDEPQPEVEPDEEVSAQRERVEVMQALQAATAHGEGGDFQEAQSVLTAAEDRMSRKGKKTRMTDALGAELADAKSRMASRSAWESGGRAEVKDAVQMHQVQRCTNIAQSSRSRMKCSKAMYSSPASSAWVAKSQSKS